MKNARKFDDINDRSFAAESENLDCSKVLQYLRGPSRFENNVGTQTAQDTVDKVFGCPTIVDQNGAVHLQGHISNVPEVSKGLQNLEDAKRFGIGIGTGLKKMGQETLEYFSRKDAVNDSIKSAGVAAGATFDYALQTSLEKKLDDAKARVRRFGEYLEDTLGYPISPQKQGECTAGAFAMFLPLGRNRILTEAEMDGFGGVQKLESMSEYDLGALGLKRFEMPKLKLEPDAHSLKATVPGYPLSFFRAKVLSPGVVEATDLFARDMPAGTGNVLLAQGLKDYNALPTKRLILSGIINPETLLACQKGVAPESTLAGKCATKALHALGITPTSYKYEWIDQTLSIVIETGGDVK